METLLLAVHVVAGILFVGPVAVAASLFPRYVPVKAGGAPSDSHDGTARLLHRITRGYGAVAIVVPVLGLVLAWVQGRLGDTWVVAAMVLTAFAGGILAAYIAPMQAQALSSRDGSGLKELGMATGLFNVLWVIVVVLMVVRPGAVAA